MITVAQLKRSVREALEYIKTQRDVTEAEVFASANENLTVRLNYTSRIPSNGVEEPKSVESYGLGIRVALKGSDGVKTGFGSEPTNLSVEGVKKALEKARRGAVLDPEYVSLPKPTGETPRLSKYHDPVLMNAKGGKLVQAGWASVNRALEVFQSSEELLAAAQSPDKVKELGLILGGDVVMLKERMAVGSYHFPSVQTDESTLIMSFATAMVEDQDAKGTGWGTSPSLSGFAGDSAAEAARSAIRAIGGQRVASGAYRVVLGPQAVAELLEWILMPGLNLNMFYAGASPFMGKMGKKVASEELYLYDDGSAAGLAASKAITDEGIPTGRTEMIKDGMLSGALSNYYETQRMMRDPKAKEKLGVEPASLAQGIAPRNGFRTGRGGGRNFDSPPSITPTNLVLEGRSKHSTEELLRMVGDGLYIGRLWYTYPVNGITAADFSGTVVGDSYLIKNGRLAAPIKPNTLRLNDNILRVINSVLGIGHPPRGTVRWASDQVTWAPEVAVEGLRVEEIAEYMEGVYQR
jgi:predicted Zn-dependent protease